VSAADVLLLLLLLLLLKTYDDTGAYFRAAQDKLKTQPGTLKAYTSEVGICNDKIVRLRIRFRKLCTSYPKLVRIAKPWGWIRERLTELGEVLAQDAGCMTI
jgi:hypothetical protein